MKEEIRRHLHALEVYNPYQVFVIYFVPVFSVVMLGYYFNNKAIRDIFALSSDFSIISKIIIFLLVATLLGKILSSFSAYILAGLRLLLYWLGLLLFNLTKWLRKKETVQRFRKALQSALTKEHHTHDQLSLYTALQKSQDLRVWYSRIYMTTIALQTTFGALLMLMFLYNSTLTFPMFMSLLIVLVLTYSSQKSLLHAEEIISHHLNK